MGVGRRNASKWNKIFVLHNCKKNPYFIEAHYGVGWNSSVVWGTLFYHRVQLALGRSHHGTNFTFSVIWCQKQSQCVSTPYRQWFDRLHRYQEIKGCSTEGIQLQPVEVLDNLAYSVFIKLVKNNIFGAPKRMKLNQNGLCFLEMTLF